MEIGQIQRIDIDAQMRTAYLDYAMSVIVARALPDARDGLKPVQRRILYAMHDMGLRSNTAHKKSARIVGEVLGKYHPHGDASVYDAMARLAQTFSLRYMLVDGQGNFGSVDGDPPAAMRYTEARLTRPAEELLQDIDKETVPFGDNFDGSLQEPLVLPGRLPNLLLNGASGIAVGMATNIPPHNLGELAEAIAYLIDHYDTADDLPVEELMKFVPGPDFPTGGLIVGAEGILSAYATGKGRVVMRAAAHVEDMSTNRQRIVVTELPYQVNKATLIERIAELAREGRLDSISDLRDESDKRGLTIVIELKRGAQPRKVLNQLFKYTALQTTFGVQLLALVADTHAGGAGRLEPRLLSLKRALQIFVEHRRVVIARRTEFDLAKARAREHILQGLLIALSNLDAVIQTIRQSADAEIAKQQLMARFKLSELQAQAILDMQLRRLAALERQKIEEEQRALLAQITELEDLLANPQKILALIRDETRALAERYGDARRTRIIPGAQEELKDEDLVSDEPVLISITQRGYVKRVATKEYRAQSRGGKGVSGQSLRAEDEVLFLFPARTLDTVLFFSDKGKVYSERVYQLPEAGRADKGLPLTNVLTIDPGEKVTAALPVSAFEDTHFCLMATRSGRIKRVAMSEFAAVRPSGLIAINLDAGDVLGWAKITTGQQEVILVTENGQALRYNERAVRAMGRQAAGVNAMHLKPGDGLASMDVVDPDGELLVVTANGYGKRTAMREYPVKGRATGGIATIARRTLNVTGRIVAARVVRVEDDITIITSAGQVLRTKVKQIRQASRATMGTRLMNLKDGGLVASVARLAAKDLASPENGAPAEPLPAEAAPTEAAPFDDLPAEEVLDEELLAEETLDEVEEDEIEDAEAADEMLDDELPADDPPVSDTPA